MVTLASGSVRYTEQSPPIPVDPALAVTDPDSAQLAGATVTISSGFDVADVFAFTPAGSITGECSSSTLTLSGAGTLAEYQAALRSVTFATPGEDPSMTARTLSFRVADSLGLGLVSTRSVDVVVINDVPVVTATTGALDHVERDGPEPIDAGLNVTDVDSPSLASATVRLTGNHAGDQDLLAAVAPLFEVTPTFEPGTGTLTLAGAATVTEYQTILRAVTYENTSAEPSTLDRTVTFTADDGEAVSDGTTKSIAITAVDFPPPTITQRIANPATADCGVVLPSLSVCVANPATPGCSAVLPTLSQCSANPALPGCSVVFPLPE